MAKQKMMWVYSPPKPKLPEAVKTDVTTKANLFIESVLKPQHIKPPPEDSDFSYVVDISTKWHRSYFYFCSTYHCPSPKAIAPYLSYSFARMEYVGSDSFNLSYMRHTEKWWELSRELTADECFAAIGAGIHFLP